MSVIAENTKQFAANSLFPSFSYCLIGFVLVQAGAGQMHGFWTVHLFLSVAGLVLAGLTIFRARLHWSLASAAKPPLRPRNFA